MSTEAHNWGTDYEYWDPANPATQAPDDSIWLPVENGTGFQPWDSKSTNEDMKAWAKGTYDLAQTDPNFRIFCRRYDVSNEEYYRKAEEVYKNGLLGGAASQITTQAQSSAQSPYCSDDRRGRDNESNLGRVCKPLAVATVYKKGLIMQPASTFSRAQASHRLSGVPWGTDSYPLTIQATNDAPVCKTSLEDC